MTKSTSLVPAVSQPSIEAAVLFADYYEPLGRLYTMLQYRRPHNDKSEIRFIGNHICTIPDIKNDKFNNYYVKVGDSPVCWASHTDTVHKSGGIQKIEKSLKDHFQLHPTEKESSCLGGDDTVGVWLMIEMISAKVPGLYIFHRGEECGTLGSRAISEKQPELVKGIEFMVSLDRKGTDSIITRQWGGRCCSDEFAASMAAKLDYPGFKYKIDTGGSITDSARYTGLVGECTNLSVGYYNQHCKTETVDITHAVKLLATLKKFDFKGLVSKRKPGEKEPVKSYSYHGAYGQHQSWDDCGYDIPYESVRFDPDKHFDTYKDPNHVPRDFIGGYFKDDTWLRCDKPEWVKARADYLAREEKRKGAKKKPNLQLVKPADKSVLDVVCEFPLSIAAMLEEWGFDGPYLASEVQKYQRDKSGASTDAADAKLIAVH